jgi:hypothetical protein
MKSYQITYSSFQRLSQNSKYTANSVRTTFLKHISIALGIFCKAEGATMDFLPGNDYNLASALVP